MKKYFSEYLNFILGMLEKDDADWKLLEKDLMNKIQFMQHERLIHLIVTCLFSILLFMSMIIFFVSQLMAVLAITVLMLCLIVPYVAHYFFLENNVQKLYSVYDRLEEKINRRV